MIAFLIMCAKLAIFIWIGGIVLTIAFWILAGSIGLIVGTVQWIKQKLSSYERYNF